MIAVLLLAVSIQAATVKTKQPIAHAHGLISTMEAKCAPWSWECDSESCVLTCVEKPGQAWTFDDKQARRAVIKARLKELLLKYRADPSSVTAAETKEATFKAIALLLSED